MRDLYSAVRETIERVIQDVVLCGVVKRYEDYVRVAGLKSVSKLTANQCDRIIEIYNRASDICASHDKPTARLSQMPTPDELRADLVKLNAIIDDVKMSRR